MFIKGVSGEEGEVVSVQGNTATVKIAANKSCEKCGICRRVSSSEMVVDAYTHRPVHKGERVVVAIKPGTIVKSATILYIFPLIALIVGYYVGTYAASALALPVKGELFPASLSFLFLFLSFIPIRLYDRKKRNDSKFRVYITNQNPL
jgi:sigma-E factor negative regulatory protein RseC